MMARGMLMMVVMISLSNAKPLKSLSPVRPLPSILHPALVASMTLQFIVHLICMRFVTTMVKAHPAYVPTVEVDYLALAQEQTVYSDVKVKFAPSLFNTVSVCEKEGCGAYLRTVFFFFSYLESEQPIIGCRSVWCWVRTFAQAKVPCNRRKTSSHLSDGYNF